MAQKRLRRSASAAHHPLDRILGSEANVRVLRVLSLHGGHLSAPEIAARSGLSRQGVWNALNALMELDVVEPLGAGKTLLYYLQRGHPLESGLKALFTAEANRLSGLLEEVTRVASDLGAGLLAVWLYGSVARRTDTPSSDLDLAVLLRLEKLRPQVEKLRALLEPAAERAKIKLSIVSITLAELRAHASKDSPFWRELIRAAMPLKGHLPDEYA